MPVVDTAATSAGPTAASSATPPAKFLQHPGEPPLNFTVWYKLFERYIFLIDYGKPAEKKLDDEAKNALLFSYMGSEGARLFASNPAFNNISDASHGSFVNAIRSQFVSSVNVVRAHFDFHHRQQASGETVMEYMTTLRSLMADCHFHGEDSYHLALQLACGCRDHDTQQKLLSLKKVDLDDFVQILQADESAKASAAAMRGSKAVQATHVKPVGRKDKRESKEKTTGQAQAECKGCGKSGHRFKSDTCQAAKVKCNFCGNIGHFERCCIKKKKSQEKQVQVVRLNRHCRRTAFQCSIGFKAPNGDTRVLPADVDSGSEAMLMDKATFDRHFRSAKLRPPDCNIVNFDRSTVKGLVGVYDTEATFEGRATPCCIYVVGRRCPTIFGNDLVEGLQLKLDCATMTVQQTKKAESSDYDRMLAEFPLLLQADMGEYPDYEHVIRLQEDSKPSVVKLRPVPLARRATVADEVQNYIDKGIWEKAEKTDWAHHLVSVAKDDGGVRLTTDLSPLNKFVIPNRFPLPTIGDLFLELKGARIFSKLDLKKAFFHIKLAEASRPLTATLTHQGIFQYRRLPMGLKEAPSVCQQLVSHTLAGIAGCIVYMDDILVFGATRQEHDDRLRQVLKQLESKNFRLQAPKCQFGLDTLKFLGYIIGNNTIRPDPEDVRPVAETPAPTNLKETQQFLGVVNYYAPFLKNLADTAEPLRRLTRKGVSFEWADECAQAFKQLKEDMINKLQLFIFDPNCDTVLAMDASNVGLGAVLSQKQDGQEVPIAFASHTLSTTERNYATNEREALAVVWACEHFEKFLLGRPFTLETDHNALTTLLRTSGSGRQSSKFTRWADRLSIFDFAPVYKKGTDNPVADHLSRVQLASNASTDIDSRPNLAVKVLQVDNITVDVVKKETEADEMLKKVRQYTRTKWPSKKQLPADLLPYYNVRDELDFDGVCITRQEERVVVPGKLRSRLLKIAHDGHPGIVRMKQKLRSSYWWPGMDQQAELFVRCCTGCQYSAKSSPKAPGPPADTRMEPPKEPWDRVSMDITGPFHTAPANERFIVVLLDQFSNFPEVLLTGDVTSTRIINWLRDHFGRYGNPNVLLTDNGPQFVSGEFTSFLHNRNITHWRTANYNPQENGQVEVFNRYLKYGAQAFTADNQTWKDGVRSLLINYRGTPNSSGKSPAELFLNRKMRQDYQLPSRRGVTTEVMKEAVSPTPQHSTPTESIGKKEAARFLRCRGPYRAGEKVQHKKMQILKGQAHWSSPLDVTNVLGDFTYELSDGKIWNARRLRHFYAEEQGGRPVQLSDMPRRSTRSTRGRPPKRYSPKK